MSKRSFVSALIDLAAGVAAIVLVLAVCMGWHRVGSDFRAIFALTGIWFFLAGLARGPVAGASLFWQSIRLGIGGLLGIAALIVNNGLHRFSILEALMVCAFLAAGFGVLTRRALRGRPARSIAITAVFVLLLAASSWAAIPRLSSYSAFESQRPAVIPFAFTVGQRTIRSTELQGRIVVLAFWASTCGECLRELPHVETVYRRFRDDPRVAFYFIDTAFGEETPDRGRRALTRLGLNIPVAFDSGPAARAMNIDGIPAVVLIDDTGALRSIHRGYDEAENLEWGLTRQIENQLAGR